jgi:hypothetical protein
LEALQRIASVRTDHRLSVRHGSDLRGGAATVVFLRFKRTWVTRITGFWHNPGLPMTKTELQSALAEATQTDQDFSQPSILQELFGNSALPKLALV